jgi:hypothetical protein
MRVDYTKAFPTGFEAMLGLEHPVRSSGLDRLLLELVKLRASRRVTAARGHAAVPAGASTWRGSSVSRAITRRWICDVPS